MPTYQVWLKGRNLFISTGEDIGKRAFNAGIFVEADDEHSAKLAAPKVLRDSRQFRAFAKNTVDDPPVMKVIMAVEVELPDDMGPVEVGLVWHKEPAKRWWQFWRR